VTYRIIDNDYLRCNQFVMENSLYPTAIDVYIGLERDGELIACTGFGWFNNKTMHHHICIKENPNRTFWWFMAYYAFIQSGIDMLIGITPSTNEKAMRIAKHYGYKEHSRIEGGCEGGDLIIQTLHKADCKWLNARVKL
jgi:RimJ/RimL family protein N-acetyltransferase